MATTRAANSINVSLGRARRDGHLGLARDRMARRATAEKHAKICVTKVRRQDGV